MKLKYLGCLILLLSTLSFQSFGQSDSIMVSAFYGDEIIDAADSSVTYYPLNLEISNLDTFDIKTVQVEVVYDSTQSIIRHVQFNPKTDNKAIWNNNKFKRFIGFGAKENYTINIWFLDYGRIEVFSTQTYLSDDQ